MKIIFLDIDGVLNYENCTARCGMYYGIEDDKVTLLKQVVDATGAKIVLSSTWRLGMNNGGHRLAEHAVYMNEKFSAQGLEIYDVTEELHRGGDFRGEEINEWLSRHPDVTEWVVLDDEWFWDFNQYDIRQHLVHTSQYLGLTDEDVKEAIDILNVNLNKE